MVGVLVALMVSACIARDGRAVVVGEADGGHSADTARVAASESGMSSALAAPVFVDGLYHLLCRKRDAGNALHV